MTALSFSALGAQPRDHWLNVQSEKKEKNNQNKPNYPYDSLESTQDKRNFSTSVFWTLQPRLTLGGGFHADKTYFQTGQPNRWFITSGLHFLNNPTYRINANLQLIQNNTLFASGSWDYTPSRKALRHYYGLGLAHRLISDKKFANFVEADSYFITASAGLEYLMKSKKGVACELKVFWGGSSYSLQLTFNYIIPL